MDMHFAVNDDSVILRATMGFSGVMPDFHLYIHPLLLKPLTWLGEKFPGIAFYSYMQILLLWLSGTVILRGILCIFARNNRFNSVISFVLGLSFIACFWLSYATDITYTVTAGMLGAAAVIQVLSIDVCNTSNSKKKQNMVIIRGMMLALFLCVMGYSLRQLTALPSVAFCAVAFLYQASNFCKTHKTSFFQAKIILISLCMVLLVFSTLVIAREIEIKQKGMSDFVGWHEASSGVIDYENLSTLPEDVTAQVGFSKNLQNLIDGRYFMDHRIDTEDFKVISNNLANQPQPNFSERIEKIKTTFQKFWETNENTRISVILPLLLALILLCCFPWRKDLLSLRLTLLGGLLLASAFILYLANTGRFPLRAVLMALLPFSALVFGLLPSFLLKLETKWQAYLIALICLGLSTLYTIPIVDSNLKIPEDQKTEADYINAYFDVDEFAIDFPDMLLILDDTLISDLRLFPDVSYGLPTNVMFWGGWNAHSDTYNAQLEAFGIDLDTIDGSIFLRDNVYLTRGVIDPPPSTLIGYISECTGQKIDYFIDLEWGGAYFFRLYAE